ncbi:unnamed protein product [Tilletia controversa]|nr:unnamed protein product [Tilletia controversa]
MKVSIFNILPFATIALLAFAESSMADVGLGGDGTTPGGGSEGSLANCDMSCLNSALFYKNKCVRAKCPKAISCDVCDRVFTGALNACKAKFC